MENLESTLQLLARIQDRLFKHRTAMLEIENELAKIELSLAKMTENMEESA